MSVFMIIPPTSTKTPKVTALVNDSPVTFVQDTGTSVNIISGRVYIGLKQTNQTPHDNSIICLQITTGNACPRIYWYHDEIPGKCCRAKIFVVDYESPLLGLQNLLSADSAEALGITFMPIYEGRSRAQALCVGFTPKQTKRFSDWRTHPHTYTQRMPNIVSQTSSSNPLFPQ